MLEKTTKEQSGECHWSSNTKVCILSICPWLRTHSPQGQGLSGSLSPGLEEGKEVWLGRREETGWVRLYPCLHSPTVNRHLTWASHLMQEVSLRCSQDPNLLAFSALILPLCYYLLISCADHSWCFFLSEFKHVDMFPMCIIHVHTSQEGEKKLYPSQIPFILSFKSNLLIMLHILALSTSCYYLLLTAP